MGNLPLKNYHLAFLGADNEAPIVFEIFFIITMQIFSFE